MSVLNLETLEQEETAAVTGFVPEPAAASGLAAPASAGIVPASHYAGSIEGDVDESDLRRPRINVVQKSSKLHGDFKFGDIVLNKQFAVLPVADSIAGKSAKVIVVHARKYFQENVEYGDNSRSFPSKEAVFAAGLFLEERKKGGASKIADLYMLIEQPEGAIPEEAAALFSIEIDGKNYASAVLTVKSIAYDRTMGKVIDADKTFAKDGVWKFGWQFTVAKQVYDKGEAFQPSLRVAGRLTDAEIAAVEVYRPR